MVSNKRQKLSATDVTAAVIALVVAYTGKGIQTAIVPQIMKQKFVRPKQMVVCTFAGCGKSFPHKYRMLLHVKSVHDKAKPFVCEFGGCDMSFSQKGNMIRHHETIHQKIKKWKCNYNGCNSTFTDQSDLKKHIKSVHDKIRSIKCSFEGCEQMFSEVGNMRYHYKAKHAQIKDIECEECGKMFCRNADMLKHKKSVHDKLRDVKCERENCEQTFPDRPKMLRHVKAVHDKLKPISCTEPGCMAKFSEKHTMTAHVKWVHRQVKEIACLSESCEKMFSTKSDMKQHFQSMHTKEGMQKKIRKQNLLSILLKKHFDVDSECHIRYRDGCVPDPDKYCARLDFHLADIPGCIVIVECDEFSHRSYLVSCEQSRMIQCSESINSALVNAICPPILFVRYNYDSATVDGVRKKTSRDEKDQLLIDFLKDIQNEKIKFTEPLNLAYINYDVETKKDGKVVASVMNDPDFKIQGAVKHVLWVQ
jgi:uncharacterized Zn-finger protein